MTLADSLVFRNASVRDILTAIGHFAQINVVFDPQFRDQNLTVDLRKTSLEDALQAVTASTRNFYKISAAKTITIIPDTPAKRREYEDEVIRTFFLSNADVKETLDLLRLVVDNRRLSPVAGVNAIAIKDTPDKIAAAAKVIRAIDKARAEVVIDVELLEVDRSRMHEYGLQIASPGSFGIDGGIDANRSDLTVRGVRSLTSSDLFVSGLPGLYYRLIKTDGNTRTLANPHLRTSDGVASSARFGEDVPVPSVTFTPLASGGVNQQPITSFTYRTVGVNIELTPRLHHDDDISLRLKLEVSSLSGVGFNNLPTFGTRYIETTIRLRDGETNLLAGLIRDEERTTLEGIPGLERHPDHRTPVRALEARNQADRHRADADAAHRPRPRPGDRRPAPVPRRARCERRRLRTALAGGAAAAGRPAAGRRRPSGRHLPARHADRAARAGPASQPPGDAPAAAADDTPPSPTSRPPSEFSSAPRSARADLRRAPVTRALSIARGRLTTDGARRCAVAVAHRGRSALTGAAVRSRQEYRAARGASRGPQTLTVRASSARRDVDGRAQRLQPRHDVRVAALHGLERPQRALAFRRQRRGDQGHARPQVAAVEGPAAKLGRP